MVEREPVAILLFSGKRKAGKDYVALDLQKRIGEARCAVMRLSGPLKKQYAVANHLDYEKLLDASEYKEMYRDSMIKWGESKRVKDPGFFCRIATLDDENSDKPLWIITDARRKSDVQYFKDNYPTHTYTVRVVASEEVRKTRGWGFVKGIDDAESECGLDSGVSWDFIISNDGDNEALAQCLDRVVKTVDQRVKFFISSDSEER
ncbi:phosphomevalonate kinase-like [Tubulanus polymorphus]|uniref:phosphomevalonate kinase-like n=1 Tax=Tubulanus polymorphus TaxID=672921 RepID=UPI003DA34BAE